MTIEKSKPAPRARTTVKSFWRELAKIGESIPAKDRAQLPRDLSRNVDHYVYGTPKVD